MVAVSHSVLPPGAPRVQRASRNIFGPTTPNALSALLCTLLHKSEAQPLSPQSLPHSLRVYPGWHQERFHFSEKAMIMLSAFKSALTQSTLLSSLESALTEKGRGWGRLC